MGERRLVVNPLKGAKEPLNFCNSVSCRRRSNNRERLPPSFGCQDDDDAVPLQILPCLLFCQSPFAEGKRAVIDRSQPPLQSSTNKICGVVRSLWNADNPNWSAAAKAKAKNVGLKKGSAKGNPIGARMPRRGTSPRRSFSEDCGCTVAAAAAHGSRGSLFLSTTRGK